MLGTVLLAVLIAGCDVGETSEDLGFEGPQGVEHLRAEGQLQELLRAFGDEDSEAICDGLTREGLADLLGTAIGNRIDPDRTDFSKCPTIMETIKRAGGDLTAMTAFGPIDVDKAWREGDRLIVQTESAGDRITWHMTAEKRPRVIGFPNP